MANDAIFACSHNISTQFFTFLRFITHWIFNVLLTDLFWGKTQGEEQRSFYCRGFFFGLHAFFKLLKNAVLSRWSYYFSGQNLSGSKYLKSLSTNVNWKSMFLLVAVFNSNCNQWVRELLFSIYDLAFST